MDQFIQKLLTAAKESGIEAAEIYVSESDSFRAMCQHGEIANYTVNNSCGLSLRGIVNGRMGYSSTQAFDDEAIGMLVSGVKESASLIEDDSVEEIYKGDESYPVVDNYNPELDGVAEEDKLKLVLDIEKTVLEYHPIQSIHDMIVHDYGPGRMMISLHAEVPADGDLLAMHDTIDLAEQALRDKFGCDAVIHMDPIVTDDEHVLHMRSKMAQLVQVMDKRVTVHDFRMVTGPTHTNLIFDVACPFDLKLSDSEVKRQVEAIVDLLDGNYKAVVTVDRIYASGKDT